jgi:hypothetical protein
MRKADFDSSIALRLDFIKILFVPDKLLVGPHFNRASANALLLQGWKNISAGAQLWKDDLNIPSCLEIDVTTLCGRTPQISGAWMWTFATDTGS